jgi:nucleoside-diphosphate-sugar epimerase
VLGSGDNRYQFVHAHDVATACILASERPGSGTYNIGAEQFGTMRETISRLCEYAGTGAHVISLPLGATSKVMELTSRLGLAPFGPYHWLMYSKSMWFELAPAEEELCWSPEYTTDAAFRESYDWFLRHRSQLQGQDASPHRSLARQGLLKLAKRVLR